MLEAGWVEGWRASRCRRSGRGRTGFGGRRHRATSNCHEHHGPNLSKKLVELEYDAY